MLKADAVSRGILPIP